MEYVSNNNNINNNNNDSNNLDFILSWSAIDNKGVKVIGQLNIINVSLLNTNNNTSEQTIDSNSNKDSNNNNNSNNNKENSQLRFTIESPRKIIHDFNKETICIVPVIFHISNYSQSLPLSFYLETLRPHESIETTTAATMGHRNSLVQKRSQYFWSGPTQQFIPNLLPDQKIQVETFVCFHRAGIYNLNRYRFNIKDVKKNTFSHQLFSPYQHLIVIEDQNQSIILQEE